MPTDFLAIPDFSRDELYSLFVLAERMRDGPYDAKPMAGKTLAMIFMKSSTRTRVSFDVGTFQLGGQALFLSPRDVQMERGEPIADTARVLSRYVDGIMIRTFAHQDVEELAKYADIPVINGLTDLLHPCQVLADLLTVRAEFGDIADKKYAWIGDGNNMANCWIDAAYRFGFDLDIACPLGYEPADHLLARAQQVSKVRILRDPVEAVRGAHVVSTDVWASMGQEQEQNDRERAFSGFTVNSQLMKEADEKAIFLHCLPAHRGEEVSADVIDGPQSRVWDEAESRLHIQKAIVAALVGERTVIPAVGKLAPNFTLPTDADEQLELSSLRGKTVVLFFYPKDDTSGCTVEACSFRDTLPRFEELDAIVLGISPDSPKSHRKFKKKFDLPYVLLADEEHAVAEAYGVWAEKSMYGRKYWGVLRTTFVIDPKGRIAAVFEKVKPADHAAAVAEAVGRVG